MEQYDQVRVKRVSENARADSWGVNQKNPVVEDAGAIVEVVFEQGHAELYVVECVDEAGRTVWLAEFAADEVERFEDALS